MAGDTLWGLAEHYYGEPRLHPVLAAANGIADPKNLAVGRSIVIPDLGSRRVHEVVPGDTLWDLAQRYYGDGTLWPHIAAANGITDPRALPVGVLLWIPDQSAPTPPQSPPQMGDVELPQSARELYKATLVPLEAGTGPGPADSDALTKAVSIRSLALTLGEAAAVRSRMGAAVPDVELVAGSPRVSERTFDTLMAFESALVPLLEPSVAQVATIPSAELASFAEELAGVRREDLAARMDRGEDVESLGRAASNLNSVLVAARTLSSSEAAVPIGLLNLERIEMVPAGIERGELVATIPLAPGEQTAVTYKEWSVTSREFTKIVTDELEEVSETGVTDNTDLSQSTSSQTQHSNQFNITGTVQGGIPIISGSSTTTFNTQNAESDSATVSRKHAKSLTQKASSRSRQEHKVTIATRTETGSEQTSTRTLSNPSPDPIRIDYFSLMRKWHVRLYRYGLRLTYDVVVPEPAATMRRTYARLDQLRSQQGPFAFPYSPSDVNLDPVNADGAPDPTGKPRYRWLADKYKVAVPPYPALPAPVTAEMNGAGNESWMYIALEFTVPQGAQIAELRVTANIGRHPNDEDIHLNVIGTQIVENSGSGSLFFVDKLALAPDGSHFLQNHTGQQKVTFLLDNSAAPFVRVKAILGHAPGVEEAWRNEVWNAIYGAAQTEHYGQQQQISDEITALTDRLFTVDTLTLRREENDEIMRSVLRFVLGRTYEYMPADVLSAFSAVNGVDLAHGIAFDQNTHNLNAEQWSAVRQHEDKIRFINQAIEWENVVSFLYSYFWDVPPSWPFVRDLRHPDSTRQAFLRAGAARVVLTVRKGWEARWMRFAQEGIIDTTTPDAPYLSIAKEIAAYDDRNYPGIPPANPARQAVRLQDSVFTTTRTDLAPSATPVTIEVEDSAGFVPGMPVVVDVHDERRIQEAVLMLAVPDPKHITIAKLAFAHDGTVGPIPLLQPGEKGALIAEWSEYTPNSGTDIGVTKYHATSGL
jgi:LysM repeat protein